MKKIIRILGFFLAPALVLIVQKTSWIPLSAGSFLFYTIALLMGGCIVSFFRDRNTVWKEIWMLLLFMILFASFVVSITICLDNCRGKYNEIIVIITMFIVGIGIKLFYDDDKSTILVLRNQIIGGCIGATIGFVASYMYYWDWIMAIQSDFFTLCTCGGMILIEIILLSRCEMTIFNEID